MKKINIHLLLLALMVLAFVSGCKEELSEPVEKNTTPPGMVTNVKVTNGPGKATLNYVLPRDKDLLYIKATYNLVNGTEVEVKASFYGNELVLDGFGDTEDHEVKIYSVNRSEVASEPVTVIVTPLENPIWAVYRSLNVIADFGGIKFGGLNPTGRDLAIEVMMEKNGKYVPTTRNIYTAALVLNQSLRGMDTIPQKFAITIRDRWLNYTDTLYTTLKPLYETTLAKSRYLAVTLPTDAVQGYASTGLSKMWDGDTFWWPNINMTLATNLNPQWVTFDLGVSAVLSRIVIWGYPEYQNAGRMYYFGGNLKEFEIWGSSNPPSDGSFNNWTRLGTFDTTKPSGSPYNVQTSEDYNYAYAGINYTFDINPSKFRYLRIKSNKNWQGTTFMAVAEVQVYGDPR